MNETKHILIALALIFAPALCTGACGPVTEPGPETEQAPPAMTMDKPLTRVWVDEHGQLRDKTLGDIEVDWATADNCEKVLLPTEPLFPACDRGTVYYYTRQGLTTAFKYGQVSHLQDPNCSGNTTHKLVGLTIVNTQQKGAIWSPRPCAGPGIYPDSMLYDRQWYIAGPADVTPATMADLPGAGPG